MIFMSFLADAGRLIFLFATLMTTMPSMPAVHENMHQRTEQDQCERPIAKDMRGVAGVNEKTEDGHGYEGCYTDAREQPASAVALDIVVPGMAGMIM